MESSGQPPAQAGDPNPSEAVCVCVCVLACHSHGPFPNRWSRSLGPQNGALTLEEMNNISNKPDNLKKWAESNRTIMTQANFFT